MVVGAPAAGAVMLLGPLLFTALLATIASGFVRRLIRAGDRRQRIPHQVAVLYRPEDAASATRITRSLTAWFGGRIVTPTWALALARAGRWIAQRPLWGRLRRVIDETRWLRPVAFAFPRRAPL